MQLLFNTIMLEVNRWAADKTPSRPLTNLLPAVAAAGFDELELWQYHVSSLDDAGFAQLQAELAANRVRCPAFGAYPVLHLQGAEAQAAEAELDALVDRAAALGARTFKIFPGRLASDRASAEDRGRTVERLLRLADRLGEHNMRLTLETHGNTLCDTLDSTAALLEELAPADHIGLCFQPYTDQDTVAALAAYDRFAAAIEHVHLQNRGPDGACTRLADGTWIDYARFLPHIAAAGFDGLLCLEFTADLFPPEGAAFDPQTVIDHAAADRDFVRARWPA